MNNKLTWLKNKKFLSLLILFLLPSITAMVCSDSFNLGENANICGYCTHKQNGTICGPLTTCYFNIYNSSFSEIILFANATNNGDGSFNYSLGTSLNRGTYIGWMICNNSNIINRDDLTFTVGITIENAPLSSASVSGTIYESSEEVRILTACLDTNNHLVSSTANVTVYYPNNSVWFEADMSEIATGLFNYTISAPSVEGVYTIRTTCDDGIYYATGIGELQIPLWVAKISDISENVSSINQSIGDIKPLIKEINKTTFNIYNLLIDDINNTLTKILNYTNLTYDNISNISSDIDTVYDNLVSLRTYLEGKWGNEDADKIIDSLKDIKNDLVYLKSEFYYFSPEEQRQWLLSVKRDSKRLLSLINGQEKKREGIYIWIVPIALFILLIILFVWLIKRKPKGKRNSKLPADLEVW